MNGAKPTAGGRRWSVIFLFTATILYFFANFQRVSVPGTIFNQLQSEMQCPAASITAMGSAFMYTYAFIQLLIGLLVDKYGGARVMTFGSVIFCIGSVLFPLADTLSMLYLSRILVGLGGGSIYLSMLKETDRLFPQNFAMLNGFELLIGYSGGIVATLPLTLAVEVWQWRAPMLLAGVLGCVAFLFCCIGYVKSEKSKIVGAPLSIRPMLKVFRVRSSWWIFGSSAVLFAVYYTLLACVGKKFLEDFGGLTPYQAAGCVFAMVLVSSVTNMLSGVLTRLCGNRRRLFLLTAVGASFAATLMMFVGILGSLGGVWFGVGFLVYAVSSGFLPISNSLIREVNAPGATGAAVSMLNFTSYLLVALFGNVAGVILDLFRGDAIRTASAVVYPASAYLSVFSLLLVLSALSVYCALRVPETRGRNVYQT